MRICRETSNIGDSLIESENDPLFSMRRGNNSGIANSGQTLVRYRVSTMPERTQFVAKLDRQVFVNLEFHCVCSGMRDSSRASSAAYANAALICSIRRLG